MKKKAGPCGRCCAAVYSRFCSLPSETQANRKLDPSAKAIAVCRYVGIGMLGKPESPGAQPPKTFTIAQYL